MQHEVPSFGTLVYLVLGANLRIGRTYRDIVAETAVARPLLVQNPQVLAEAAVRVSETAGQLRYLSSPRGFPTYRNTGFSYFGLGEEGFPHMLEDLGRAERFVFLEYFIIEPGTMWDAVLDILRRKAAAGVDVRVLYDDIGSVGTLPASYAKVLEAEGIKCETFNRVSPVANIFVNHRDHRKICVIDGRVAYSGGVNLADEYINATVKFGHWKDNVFRLTGERVWTYTQAFLTMWNALRHEDGDYLAYKAEPGDPCEPDGYVCPYAESPLDLERTGLDVYLNIINQARSYCHIMTPYLIVDTDLVNALILAAVGTQNLDYRSLYLHFENGVLLVGASGIQDVRDDVEATLAASHEMTPEECNFGLVRELGTTVLRLLAPLL